MYANEVELETLASEHELLKKIHDEIAFQYEQARLRVTARTAQLQVIDEAVPADRPLSRGRTTAGAGALIVGGAVGALFVLVSRRYRARPHHG
jgi:uncharacterized protein involved in exopolysaccharide biosynthesis